MKRIRATSRALFNLLLLILLCSASAAGAADNGAVTFHKQYVDGPAGQVHVLISHPAAGGTPHTPVACFAPNPASGRYFRLFMQTLGSDRVMIAPDYPGLGQSDAPASVPSLADYTAAMAAALERLGYGTGGKGRVDVCGYHTGAFVAMDLAAVRPDLVRKLVLMGIPYYSGEERRRQYEKNYVPRPIEENLDGLQGSWDFAVTNRQQGVTLERGYDNFVDLLKAGERRSWAYHAVFSWPAEQGAARVAQPVLILNTHGSLQEETRAIAPLFPDARLVEIPELHHGIFDVGPEILAGHARPFLDESRE